MKYHDEKSTKISFHLTQQQVSTYPELANIQVDMNNKRKDA